MLAAEGRQISRPRPPAQLRRSASKGVTASDSVPPPPYALAFPHLQESNDGDMSDMSDPVAATASMMGIQLDTGLDIVTEDDVRQKSREELTKLFLQAERIIRARETELNVAANLGRNLLETNEALKLRHDALLSRLPAMQYSTSTLPFPSTPPRKAPRLDAWTTEDEISSSSPSHIHSRTNSIISSARDSPIHSRTNSLVGSTTPGRRGNVRRISASPSALFALSETNAELIAELTRLRASTDSEQVDGARRLRKLEREIGGLKTELDTSQRVNAELEERVREQQGEERRREREERLKKLRASDIHDQDGDQEIRDFAPQGHGVETWDSVACTPRLTRHERASSDTSHHSDSAAEQSHSDCDASASSEASSRPVSQYNTITPGEYAVVAQLYRKVEELQEANAELGARNRVTSEQLARAEREALEIKRVYDEIGEEMGAEADAEQSEDGGAGTIRAASRSSSGRSSPRSLRSPRSSRNTTPKASSWSFRNHVPEDPFLDDTPTNKGGTGSRRALGNKHMYKTTRSLKSRKPLTDALFAPPTSTPHEDAGLTPSIVLVPSRSPRPRSKLKGKARAKAKSAPFPSPAPLHRNFSASSFLTGGSLSGTGMTPSASASSFLTASASSFASLAHYVGRNGGRSLGSELGDEFGADWGVGADVPGHNSLFDEESFRVESEAWADAGSGTEDEEEHEDPALAALRDALNPPHAGRLLEQDEHILPVGALQASPGEAFQLVSHAVAARPNRWLKLDDKRIRGAGPRAALTSFAARGVGAEDPWETTRYPDIEPEADRNEDDTIRVRRRDRALERMASTSNRRMSHSGGDAFELVPSASQLQTADYYPRRSRNRNIVEKLKRTSGDALIELWIFLQFVVVICTFLYTMSRRGPREVLGAPPRRA